MTNSPPATERCPSCGVGELEYFARAGRTFTFRGVDHPIPATMKLVECSHCGELPLTREEVEAIEGPIAATDPGPAIDDDIVQRDPRLRRLLDCLVDEYQPLAVWLFGSRAYGRARPDSDYDIVVVVPEDTDEALDPDRAWATGVRAAVPADVFPASRAQFERAKHMLGTIPGEAFQRGRLLYGHP